MRNAEEGYLIKIALFAAGAAGATVSMYRRKIKLTWWGKAFHVFCGALTSYYVTPIVIAIADPFFKINYNIVSSFAFLVGLMGFKAVDMVIDWIYKRFKSSK